MTQLPQELPHAPLPSPTEGVSPTQAQNTTPPPQKIEIMVDKIKVNGPKVDNSYSVTLEVGEYEQSKIAEIMSITQPANFKVVIEEFKNG